MYEYYSRITPYFTTRDVIRRLKDDEEFAPLTKEQEDVFCEAVKLWYKIEYVDDPYNDDNENWENPDWDYAYCSKLCSISYDEGKEYFLRFMNWKNVPRPSIQKKAPQEKPRRTRKYYGIAYPFGKQCTCAHTGGRILEFNCFKSIKHRENWRGEKLSQGVYVERVTRKQAIKEVGRWYVDNAVMDMCYT